MLLHELSPHASSYTKYLPRSRTSSTIEFSLCHLIQKRIVSKVIGFLKVMNRCQASLSFRYCCMKQNQYNATFFFSLIKIIILFTRQPNDGNVTWRCIAQENGTMFVVSGRGLHQSIPRSTCVAIALKAEMPVQQPLSRRWFVTGKIRKEIHQMENLSLCLMYH